MHTTKPSLLHQSTLRVLYIAFENHLNKTGNETESIYAYGNDHFQLAYQLLHHPVANYDKRLFAVIDSKVRHWVRRQRVQKFWPQGPGLIVGQESVTQNRKHTDLCVSICFSTQFLQVLPFFSCNFQRWWSTDQPKLLSFQCNTLVL